MFNISGLNTLLRVVRETGIKPTKLHILSGVSKPRHGLWIVTHKGLVEEEGYGIDTLVDYNLKEAEMFTEDTVCKYIGLTVGQQEVCVFGIEAGDEEVIRMKTSLNTTIGNRQVCGEGCEDHEDHKPLVTIKPVVENKDDVPTEGTGENLSEPKESVEDSTISEATGDSESTETVSTDTVVETKNTDSNLNPEIEPDFEYAQSLSETGNKNEQKAALDSYAQRFGIELNRGTKFDAMMVDFKEKASA